MVSQAKIDELIQWLKDHPTKEQWADAIRVVAWRDKLTIPEILEIVRENLK